MYKIMLAIALMVGFIRLMCFLEKVSKFFQDMRSKVRPRRDFFASEIDTRNGSIHKKLSDI